MTHYPGQARPGAEQPILLIEDELRRLSVPRGQYDRLVSLMVENRIGLIAHHSVEHQIDLYFVGKNEERDLFLVYMPGSGDPGHRPLTEWGSLAPHWFWATRS